MRILNTLIISGINIFYSVSKFLHLFIVCACVYACTCHGACVGGQRTIYGSWFSPPLMGHGDQTQDLRLAEPSFWPLNFNFFSEDFPDYSIHHNESPNSKSQAFGKKYRYYEAWNCNYHFWEITILILLSFSGYYSSNGGNTNFSHSNWVSPLS